MPAYGGGERREPAYAGLEALRRAVLSVLRAPTPAGEPGTQRFDPARPGGSGRTLTAGALPSGLGTSPSLDGLPEVDPGELDGAFSGTGDTLPGGVDPDGSADPAGDGGTDSGGTVDGTGDTGGDLGEEVDDTVGGIVDDVGQVPTGTPLDGLGG